MNLRVKNMVCDRCIKVVIDELNELNLPFKDVDLGTIYFEDKPDSVSLDKLKDVLVNDGFEILEDKEAKTITKVKELIISEVHKYAEKMSNENYSSLLARELGVSYSYLSKLFSQSEGQTIEHFIIKQKVERAKELLTYGELNLSEIAYDLNYSSSQHLSRQFKQVTGMTPSEFRLNGTRKKLDTI